MICFYKTKLYLSHVSKHCNSAWPKLTLTCLIGYFKEITRNDPIKILYAVLKFEAVSEVNITLDGITYPG